MKLKKQEIKHIAKLARLELSREELETYGSQLSDILGYIDQLKEVEVAGVEPTAQVTGLLNVWREDRVEGCDSGIVKKALEQAPDKEGDQIKVKRVFN